MPNMASVEAGPQHLEAGQPLKAGQQHLEAGQPLKAGQQHLKALERANRVRRARAELKRGVASGRLGADEVVLSCPWEADKMEIFELLTSQKRWGRERCRRLLLSIGIPENKHIGTLTERQRLALAAELRKRAVAPAAPLQRKPSQPPQRVLSVA